MRRLNTLDHTRNTLTLIVSVCALIVFHVIFAYIVLRAGAHVISHTYREARVDFSVGAVVRVDVFVSAVALFVCE